MHPFAGRQFSFFVLRFDAFYAATHCGFSKFGFEYGKFLIHVKND